MGDDSGVIAGEQINIVEAWKFAVGQLQSTSSKKDFDNFIKFMVPVAIKNGVFMVEVANQYTIDFSNDRFKSTLDRALSGFFNKTTEVRFVLPDTAKIATTSTPRAKTTQKEIPAGLYQDLPEQKKRGPKPGSTRKIKENTKSDISSYPADRKSALLRNYGTEVAAVIKPDSGRLITTYFQEKWMPILGITWFGFVLVLRSKGFWNPLTGEKREVIYITLEEIAVLMKLSVATIKRMLKEHRDDPNSPTHYFFDYKVNNGKGTHGREGLIFKYRADDPLTPEDQEKLHHEEPIQTIEDTDHKTE
jgi:hypothetical protein